MKDSTGSPTFDTEPTTDAVPTLSSIFDTPTPPKPMVFVEDIYSPTRLDYFAARALQGLVIGRSEKYCRVAPRDAVTLAKELVELLDKATD